MKVLAIAALLIASCNVTKNSGVSQIEKENDVRASVFIFCRGTFSKAALIGNKFNINDKKITHCGLGFLVNNSYQVINVTDNRNIQSNALIIETFDSFIRQKDVYYVSIWECTINNAELKRLRLICDSFLSKKILFDYDFSINNGDLLYCSEFCASILNEANIEAGSFKPVEIILTDPIYKAFLKRKKFIYYPVDFFEVNKNFKKIYEWEINK